MIVYSLLFENQENTQGQDRSCPETSGLEYASLTAFLQCVILEFPSLAVSS